jgi:hypothetical protein
MGTGSTGRNIHIESASSFSVRVDGLHVTEAAERMVAELCAQLLVIPGAVTSQLLPLDISVNAPIEELTNEV